MLHSAISPTSKPKYPGTEGKDNTFVGSGLMDMDITVNTRELLSKIHRPGQGEASALECVEFLVSIRVITM